ncbi:MAG: hypothetical protein NZ879_07185 [Archaeoglobaceae archaeon]|nr:hypothetical protein [Archaeoglobaceae archaeon]MDW8118749.1 hypothetical protein [Archaeoglobaceae archaeon]
MKILHILILIALLISSGSAGVIEISKMEISVNVTDKAHLKYDITFRNLIDKPLVPGISELRLQKIESTKILFFPIPFGEQRKALNVENLKVYSGEMNFKAYSENHGNYSTIYYEIWYPIEPFGDKSVTIEFDADAVDKGILFKSITIPIGGDIDIKNVEILLNSDWKLCYREGDIRMVPAEHLTFLTAEFSLLPLPMLPIRGYFLFWGTLIAILGIMAILVAKRK